MVHWYTSPGWLVHFSRLMVGWLSVGGYRLVVSVGNKINTHPSLY